MARCMPTSRGNIHEPPKSTTSPRFEKISLKRARSDATIRSQPSARLQPAPAATPLTAAIVGLASSCSRNAARPTMRIPASAAAGPLARSRRRAVAEIGARAETVARARDHEHPVVGVLGDLVEERR